MLLFQLRRFRHLTGILLAALYGAALNLLDDLKRQSCSQRSQSCLDIACCFVASNINRFLSEHVARIKRYGHFDNRDAGARLAVINGPGDGSGAAVFRQERGVDVNAAVRRHSEDIAREDLTVSGDDEEIRLERLQGSDAFGCVDALRLKDGNAMFLSDGFHAASGLPG